jgi:hypothetical protein
MKPEEIRALIAQENEMVNHRMNWFLILQGFMFASIAFAWEKGVAISVVFCCVGVLSAISVGTLLRYGVLAIRSLEQMAGGDAQRVLGRGHDTTPRLAHALMPWNFLPLLFVLAWIVLMLIRLQGVD